MIPNGDSALDPISRALKDAGKPPSPAWHLLWHAARDLNYVLHDPDLGQRVAAKIKEGHRILGEGPK